MKNAKLEWLKSRIESGRYQPPLDLVAESLEDKIMRYRLRIKREVRRTKANERHEKRIQEALRQ
jgi:hypothetical protein